MQRFEYDVFVSYAHHDNEGDSPWVSRFVEHLKISLKQRLGAPVEVFFDTSSLQGHEHLQALIQKAGASALFLPIVSPSYVLRDWTRHELAAFNRLPEADSRIFAIEILPPGERTASPPPLDTLIASPFWHRPQQTIPMTIDPAIDRERYLMKVADLAEKLRARLISLRGGPAPRPMPPEPHNDAAAPTVLLGQVTGDLEVEAGLLRSYLEQFGIRVLPEADYSQGGVDFCAAFQADARRASVFVQLLGPWSERRPPDLPDGYACQQYDMARAANLKTLLWCRPDLDETVRTTHRDARLFAAPELVSIGMAEFKTEVLRATQPKPPPVKPQPDNSFIFVDSDRADLGLARSIADDLERRKKKVYLPIFDGPPEEVLRDVEESMTECSGLVVVFGLSRPTWVRAQLRFASKVGYARRNATKVIAVYLHPPRDKEELGILSDDIVWIDGRAPGSAAMIGRALGVADA